MWSNQVLFKRWFESCPQTPENRVLVTGSHRSGTTWVGTILAAHEEAEFIHEPLNPTDGHPLMRKAVRHNYSYICPRNERPFLEGFRGVLKAGCQAEECWKAHVRHSWSVIKDPFALFSVPWFALRFNCRSVITVRQPVSLISSLKRLQWHFDHRHLLEQPLLMRDWLGPYRAEMKAVIGGPADDVIAQGCLLWRMIYGVVARMKDVVPPTVIVRHEDLSLDPWAGFYDLHDKLGVSTGAPTDKAIEFFSNSLNPKEASVEPPHTVALDSRANLDNWKHRLSEAEVDRIRRLTADVASLYYTEAELDDFAAAHQPRRLPFAVSQKRAA
jgi:hypothetical protein